VIVEELNRVTFIAINRPEKRNCVNPETARELITAFKTFEDNPDSPVAILYGKGGTFCSGYDLEYLASQAGNNQEFDPLFFSPSNKDGFGPMVVHEMTIQLKRSKPNTSSVRLIIVL